MIYSPYHRNTADGPEPQNPAVSHRVPLYFVICPNSRLEMAHQRRIVAKVMR